MSLKVIVAGMGVQGAKRQRAAGSDVIATVDPFVEDVEYKDVRDMPLSDFNAAILCIPDEPKVELIEYFLFASILLINILSLITSSIKHLSNCIELIPKFLTIFFKLLLMSLMFEPLVHLL